MDNVFPFGFPWQTSLYLVLYLATLAMHMVLMNYVIAGTFVMVVRGSGWLSGGERGKKDVVVGLLTDWMPFALGGAITAGVAPLLFIQILYQERFYTANLLLFHRWMAILPVLIVGFYLLYLLKSHWIENRSALIRSFIGVATLGCFLFVGYSWTENHLLSNRDQVTWTRFYEKGTVFYFESTLFSRLLVWFLGAFSTLWLMLGWQLRYHQSGARQSVDQTAEQDKFEQKSNLGASSEKVAAMSPASGKQTGDLSVLARRVSRNGILSLSLALIALLVYGVMLSSEVRAALFSSLTMPYLVGLVIGAAMQLSGWWRVQMTGSLTNSRLIWITVGLVLSLLSMLVLRETIRLVNVDIAALYAQHSESAKVGGLAAFLLFLFINTGIIIWCVRQISRERLEN